MNRATLVLVLLGIGWRLVRYFLQFPIWGDESMLCVNFLIRDYEGLTRQLAYYQVAPILFLWVERTVICWLGASELSLHLVPLLAGTGAVLVFWRVCRLTLPPMATLFAVGLLAVSYYPVRYSCEGKPYSFDLFLSTMLLWLALEWLRDPQQRRWLMALVVLTPIALTGSYPAVFVAGAVSLLLLPALRQQRSCIAWGLFTSYNAVMVCTFLAHYLCVGRAQVEISHLSFNPMEIYWQGAFPPIHPLSFFTWFLDTHTGLTFAYPIGGSNGGSTVTFLLVVVGAYLIYRNRTRRLAVLCMLPFALTLIAALMHCYPYGGGPRVAQHLTPLICMLVGLGIAGLVTGWRASWPTQQRVLTLATWGFALFAVVGTIRDVAIPYKSRGAWMARRMVEELREQMQPDDRFTVVSPLEAMNPNLCWYLGVHLGETNRPLLREKKLDAGISRVWALHYGHNPCNTKRRAEAYRWHWREHLAYLKANEDPYPHVEHFQLFCLTRLNDW